MITLALLRCVGERSVRVVCVCARVLQAKNKNHNRNIDLTWMEQIGIPNDGLVIQTRHALWMCH